MREVDRARSAFRLGRAQTPSSIHPGQLARAADLALAMQTYADASVAAGIPLPYRYRDELRLYETLTRLAYDGRSGT